jgi:hypothetical protein
MYLEGCRKGGGPLFSKKKHMLKLVYMAVKKRLGARLLDVRWIDWYLNQYAQEGEQSLWTTPALFIEFPPLDWRKLGNGVQVSDATMLVHLVNETHYDDDKRIIADVPGHLEEEAEVYAALEGFRCKLSYLDEYASLAGQPEDRVLMETTVRLRTYPDHDMSRLLVSVQEFTTRIYDYGATPEWQQVTAALQADVQKAATVAPPFRR